MLDRRLIQEMYDAAQTSPLDGAQTAASVYWRMLAMAEGQSMTVQFEPGEDFSVICVSGGYEVR
ncbi:MAG: hypothetical protein CSA35_08220 [Dethiosulfovibrio peptidovorans]|nr:MAG: hypothetical protein CSA35_08220 [Dethiosulfovibrio peptidovorans]